MVNIRQNWLNLTRSLGCDEPKALEVLTDLTLLYLEPVRHYHTLEHIHACLLHFQDLKLFIASELEPASEEVSLQSLELALWFHDAVYEPKGHNNERSSISLMYKLGDRMGVPDYVLFEAEELILATRHILPPSKPLTKWMVDIDLSILGSEPRVFDAYEKQIRQEYEFVSDKDFRSGRAVLLTKFLEREFIYSTHECFKRWEDQARKNLKRSIENLKKS